MTFQIGEKVVYPNQGVGTIENISSRSFGCGFETFYLLRFCCNSMTVLVPLSTAAHIGLRRIAKEREMSRILSFLAHGRCAASGDWKIRFRENSEKMQSGCLYAVAEVLKGLLQVQLEKPLSFRDKKTLDRARHMLISELSIVRGVSEAQAVSLLERALSKASLALPMAS